MPTGVRVAITLACTECRRRNYQTQKSKRNSPDRVEFRKYCRWCGSHTLHRETRAAYPEANPPWALSLHRPDTSVFRDSSGLLESLELVPGELQPSNPAGAGAE